MHEPPKNIEICARNAEETRKWQENIKKLTRCQQQVGAGTGNKRKKGGAITIPKDCFGVEMTKKVPILKLEAVLLVYKVATLVDQAVWGWECPTPGCTLRDCHLCRNMCQLFAANSEFPYLRSILSEYFLPHLAPHIPSTSSNHGEKTQYFRNRNKTQQKQEQRVARNAKQNLGKS